MSVAESPSSGMGGGGGGGGKLNSFNSDRRYNQEYYLNGHLFETQQGQCVVSFRKTLYMFCLELV